MRSRIAVMLALCASAASAQNRTTAAPRMPDSDPAGRLANAPEIYGARRATLNVTCGSYQSLLLPFADSSWTAQQLVAYLLHGTSPFTKDTAPTPPIPPVVPPPVPPVAPPAPDPTLPAAPAGWTALRNSNPMGILTAPVVFVPVGWGGRTIVDTVKGGGCVGPTACVAGEGAVRILSNYAFMAFSDPIACFQKPGCSHLH